jgi:RNA 2',3'-cyclic 3'-phosphodiesterase
MSADPQPFVRAFIAVEIPDEVRRQLARVQAEIRATRAHVGWVQAPNLHISLAFLGNITWAQAEALGPALDEAAAPLAPFSCEVANLGTFGGPRSPRVIWAGLRGAGPLCDLQKRVAEAVRAQGIELEDREFSPHLTLGRVRSSRGREALVLAVESVGDVVFGRVEVAGIVLMQSVLKPAGPEYTPLRRSPLKA